MKTIEERAEHCQQYQEIYGGNFASAYKKGAEEQRKIDIDKACKWLCKYCPAQFDEDNVLQGCEGTEASSCPTLESLINAIEE